MNNNARHPGKREKGAVLLMVVGVVAALTVLCASYGAQIFNEASIARRNVDSAQAFWIAEAGLQKAAWDYSNNDCHGMKNSGNSAACASCSSCGSGNRAYTADLGVGDYSVVIDPVAKTYTSTGSVWQGAGEDRALLARRKVKLFFGQRSIFNYAGFAESTLTVSNNALVDSYNSTDGPYNAGTASTNGNIGTNGSTVNVIDIGNNATIYGGVSTGPGGTVDVSPGVTITGEITHTNDVYLEPVSVPEDIQTAAYYGALEVSGTTDLATGSYRYDSIALDNDGILNINGDVKIYLTSNTSALTTGNNTVAVNIIDGGSVVIYTDGAVDLGNKVIINNNNINPKPADFMIFSRYAGENGVVIDNSNTFYGAIYAPQTSVELSNNAAFFGSVIGGTLDIVNNGALHYDEALAQVGAPWQPASLRDWQETFD